MELSRGGSAEVRPSDADREAVAALLRTSAVEGRLGLDELSERLDRLYGATTVGELEGLVADLPGEALEARRRRRARRWRFPGRVPISITLELEQSPPRALDLVVATVGSQMLAHGYVLEGRTSTTLVFVRPQSQLIVTATKLSRRRSSVALQRVAPRRVRDAFRSLADS
jgi:uncharacterized protein DUF1707